MQTTQRDLLISINQDVKWIRERRVEDAKSLKENLSKIDDHLSKINDSVAKNKVNTAINRKWLGGISAVISAIIIARVLELL